MIQHPIHKSYYIDSDGNFYHQLGPLRIQLSPSPDGTISIAAGDRREVFTPEEFLRDIRKHQTRNKTK